MTPTPDPIAAIERALEGVTAGPWYPGHLGTDSTCQCRSIVDDGRYMGAIATVHVANGLPIGEEGNDAPPADEAAANMRFIAACNPVAITALLSLARQAADKDAEIVRLRRLATDRKYMLEAYRNMLGPKGLEVAAMWERKGVIRFHTDWEPAAAALTGEDRAQVLLDVEAAVSEPLDFNDSALPAVDVRSLTTETSDAQG